MNETIKFAAEFVQFARTKISPLLQIPQFDPSKLEPFREPISGIDGYFYLYQDTLIIYFAGSNEWCEDYVYIDMSHWIKDLTPPE